MYKIIIDANVWIKYARAKDIAPLLNRFTSFNLLPFTNNYLLSEIFDAVVENKWMSEKQAFQLIEFVRKFTFNITETPVYRLSPDPKDNYLFDLAIQNNCIFIVSDDSLLSQFVLRPVPVYTSAKFFKTFPL